MRYALSLHIAAILLLPASLVANGQTPSPATWTGPEGGGTWESDANWDTGVHPNAVGAAGIFDGSNQSSVRAMTLPATARTVGAITILGYSTFNTTFTGGTFRFDAVDGGPARVTVQGVGTGQGIIASSMIFTDSVVFDIQNRVGNSAAGGMTVNGNIIAASSTGALIKEGPGTLTLAFTGGSGKAYSGATIVKEGRFRHSVGGIPSATSSVTVEAGAQIHLIGGGEHLYGPSADVVVTLNGFGRLAYAEIPGAPTIPALAASAGAILVQPTGSGASTPAIANRIHLASDSSVSVRNGGTLTFSNVVSGPGRLVLAAGADDLDNGTLELLGANTFAGGVAVQAGVLRISGSSATIGSGNLTVAVEPGHTVVKAHAEIATGVANAIFDGSTLRLAGGGLPGVADQAYLTLGAGVNEIVGSLVLGNIVQTLPGSYGSSMSAATHKFDEYFSGTGVVTIGVTDANFDNDSDVDGADFLAWQRGFGATPSTPGTNSMGDANGDGHVNTLDFNLWKSKFGTTPAHAVGQPIPEPAPALLVVGAFLNLFASRRRERLKSAECRTG